MTGVEYAGELYAYEHLLDPITVKLLGQLGIRPDMSCLEVGAGGGSIARWLADQLTVGNVTAVDIDISQLTPAPRLSVRRLDVQVDDLKSNAWDLIHVRSVLAYLGDRAGALQRLAAALLPGGRLIVEEPNFLGLAACQGPTPQALAEYGRALRRLLEYAGAQLHFGLLVPTLLREAGLVHVHMVHHEFQARAGDGAWGDFLLVRSSVESRRMVELGLLRNEVAREAVELLGSGFQYNVPMQMCSTWGTARDCGA